MSGSFRNLTYKFGSIKRGVVEIAKMYKQTCTHLSSESSTKVNEFLNSFDAVITDCDGVLWVYGEAIDGAVDTINRLKEMGKSIYFCTNNSTKTRHELLQKAIDMGFNINADSILSTAHATAAYLHQRKFNKKVFIIGSEGITKELDTLGIAHTSAGPDCMEVPLGEFVTDRLHLDNEVGAVVVGFDEHFSFPKMVKAASYLNNPDCLFIATNTDERFPMPNFVVPGTGSFVKAVETCAERKATVMGKPNPAICESLLVENKIVPSRTLMIGDRANTDILLGFNCGFQTLLVGTGIHRPSDVEVWRKSENPEDKKLIPDVYLPKLGDLLPLINSSSSK